MNAPVPLPAEKAKMQVMIGIPSFGMVSMEFLNSINSINYPTNCFRTLYWPRDYSRPGRAMDVDAARNKCVEVALERNCEYIFFRDDDVIDTDGQTLLKLMARKVDIIGGVYCVKNATPKPLIYMPGENDGFTDWRYGDVFKCGAIGMGLTLIRTEIFKKIPQPWFRTVTHKDPDDEIGKLADYFTEDIYFCWKARKYGFDTWVDTGIQAKHQDVKNDVYYGYEPSLSKYGKYDKNGSFFWVPTGEEIEAQKQKKLAATEKAKGPVRFDLGAGWKREGYITVDAEGDCDEKGDIRALDWLVEKHGLADEIYSHHALEHLPFNHTMPILRDWVKALKPGGKLEIGVPDLEWCVKQWLEAPETDPEKYGFKMATIFGLQTSPGHEHRAGFTLEYLNHIAAQLPLEDVVVERTHKEGQNQPTLWLKGRKKAIIQLADTKDRMKRFVAFDLDKKKALPTNGKGTKEHSKKATKVLVGRK